VGLKPTGSRRERAFPLLLLSCALAVVAAAALAFAYLSVRPPGDASPEAGFARDMHVHHAQAVEMAEIVRGKTENERIGYLATDMMLTQQAQLGQMQGWLATWGLPLTGPEPQMAWMGHSVEGRMPGMASTEEINELRNAPPEEADAIFLRLMIPHHEAAVPMSEAILERTDRPEVVRLAEAIIESQESEIELMEGLLAEMGEEPPPPVEGHEGHGHEGHEH
jgi:uncharacterized protein (DUF305 family)